MQTSDMGTWRRKILLSNLEENIQGFGREHMIFCKVPPVFLNKISPVKKHGGQKGLVKEKYDKEGWQE